MGWMTWCDALALGFLVSLLDIGVLSERPPVAQHNDGDRVEHLDVTPTGHLQHVNRHANSRKLTQHMDDAHVASKRPAHVGKSSSFADLFSLSPNHQTHDDKDTATDKATDDKATDDKDKPAKLECGKDMLNDNLEDTCPESCPFASEMENEFCHFKCVEEKECGAAGSVSEATIPDKGLKECRRCEVEGCAKCVSGKPGEDIEMCEECMPGYYKLEGGEECKSHGDNVFLGIAVVAVIGSIAALIYYVVLVNRPYVNEKQVEYGLAQRSRSKIRQRQRVGDGQLEPQQNDDGTGDRAPYPLGTNLMVENVGGPGLMSFFRFEMAVLIWCFIGLFLQIVFGLFISTDIWVIGRREAKTHQQFCNVIHWGRERQVELVWVKVLWLAIMYVVSFVGCIYYAYQSKKLFGQLDSEHTTMADYCALLRGLPELSGSENVEDELKDLIVQATGEKLVGVSVCWDFHDHDTEHKVFHAIEVEVEEIEKDYAKNTRGSVAGILLDNADGSGGPDGAAGLPEVKPGDAPGEGTGVFDMLTREVLNQWKVDLHHHHSDEAPEDFVKSLKTSDQAFVVFETEQGRDRAVEKLSAGGLLKYKNQELTMREEIHEPESVTWEHAGVSEATLNSNLVKAVLKMSAAVIAWTVILYLPYAHYMASFTFKNGDKPGEIAEGVFIGLVVGAQIGLFVVANMATHHAGYRYEDEKQCGYIQLYNGALIVNLVMDIGLTTMLSYHRMVGQGIRTADGRLLGDLATYQEIFESFPMQKTVGHMLFLYCWPATFFVPFSVEPIGMFWLPYHIGCYIVGTNPRIKGRNAQKCLRLGVFEAGRYADVMFNSILAAVIPFVAPGYIIPVYAAMLFSHTYLYCMDHWAVLRAKTRFYLANDICDIAGQKIAVIPVGLLAAGLVFKWNQMKAGKTLGGGPLQGTALFAGCLAAYILHSLAHYAILEYVIPGMVHPDVKAEASYAECAAHTPATWFSMNPVFCLRSRYLLKHDPPMTPYLNGKEHLMKVNEKIGAHFDQKSAEVECYKSGWYGALM